MKVSGFQLGSSKLLAVELVLFLAVMACSGALTSNVNITFLNEPADKECDLNAFIMLLCAVSDLPENHHLVWTHNAEPILEGTQPIGETMNLNYRGLGAGSLTNLFIQSAAKEDHGSYFSCRVYNGSLISGEEATLVAESRTAIVTVKYPPPAKFPLCQAHPREKDEKVNVVLSCCTEVASVPMSLAWMAQGENASWRITQQANTGHETGQNCVDVDIHYGFNFSMYQCQMNDALGNLNDFVMRQCKISKVNSVSISLKFLDHTNAQFNCTVDMGGMYQYLWHLQDEDKTIIQQVSSLSLQSTLVLKLSKVSNGSFLSCSVFDQYDGYAMGTTDLKIVLQAQPPGKPNPTMLIIGVVIGGIVGTLIFGLSMYFIMVRCSRRNARSYASLNRGSEQGMQIGPGNTYIYHKTGSNGNMNGTVVTAEGGTIETEAEEIPPKPGGHRTISWEPEDMIIRSNGGVINHSEDPKRRNVEGLVYADLAFQEGEEEQDAEPEAEPEDALKGAVGGDENVSKPGTTRQNSIEYASIVPPPRSLRF